MKMPRQNRLMYDIGGNQGREPLVLPTRVEKPHPAMNAYVAPMAPPVPLTDKEREEMRDATQDWMRTFDDIDPPVQTRPESRAEWMLAGIGIGLIAGFVIGWFSKAGLT